MTSILDSNNPSGMDVNRIQSLFFWGYPKFRRLITYFNRLDEAPQQFTTFSLAISTLQTMGRHDTKPIIFHLDIIKGDPPI